MAVKERPRKVEGLGWVLSSWEHRGHIGVKRPLWVSPGKGLAIQSHWNVSQGWFYQSHFAALPAQDKLCNAVQNLQVQESPQAAAQRWTD